jgi:hypothetical protein
MSILNLGYQSTWLARHAIQNYAKKKNNKKKKRERRKENNEQNSESGRGTSLNH